MDSLCIAHSPSLPTHLLEGTYFLYKILLTDSLSLFLVFSNSDTSGIYESKSWLEKVIVAGITGTPTKALLSCGE